MEHDDLESTVESIISAIAYALVDKVMGLSSRGWRSREPAGLG